MTKKFTKISFVIFAAAAILTTGCIRNDIPYPRIQANFLAFNVRGQDAGTVIDSLSRTVSITLPETVDIENVHVEEYSITPGSHIEGIDLDVPLNLSSPVYADLVLYQSWTWTISATQTIDRYFRVAGQVGVTVIDVPGRRVVAYVTKSTPLNSILVEEIKLGPEGSEISPDPTGTRMNFTNPVDFTVTSWGRSSTWTVFVEHTDVDVRTEHVDAWTQVAWVYGQGEAGKDNGVEYRLKGDTDWTRVPDSNITVDGGSFMAKIIHLSPLTTYQTRVFSGEAYGETVEFTTGNAVQVPNTNLDEWWLDGKVWNPWPEGGEQYWDTGNKGATTLGSSNSMPTDDTSSGTGWAAKLETRFVGIGMLGKLAAGNLFVGKYVRTDGTNGILSFGRPFTERPTKMRGYLKYNSAEINYASTEWNDLKGQPDTCIVWVGLIDSAEPFEIRTNPKNRNLFDPDGDYVVGYGKIQYGQTIEQYIPFEFDIEYKSTSRVPTYILITASASKYGDYFTGGAGSVLYLDDLELLYDY